jgi:two-component system, chemotaxis family, chemotaxis protein CheY
MTNPLSLLRLLVVDDNTQMRTIMVTVLGSVGIIDVHQAPDGMVGLAKLAELNFDCIYADFEMPRMNGLEFVETVRRTDSTHRFTPIIMLTGYSDYAHLSLARDKGVTEFLRKPVTARDILLRLEAVIMRPRPFVNSDAYFGPDRRRNRPTAYFGPKRRAKDNDQLVEL